MIKNIIFDMDGVILTGDAKPLFDYYSKKLNIHIKKIYSQNQ